MAGLPPHFAGPPPVVFDYLPPGLVLRHGGTAFDNEQIGMVAKGFFTHKRNEVHWQPNFEDEAGMFAAMRPDSKPENDPIDRALTWKYLQTTPWNQNGGVTQVVDNVW